MENKTEHKIEHGGYVVESNIDLINKLRKNQDQIILWENFNIGDKFYDNEENEYIVDKVVHNDGEGYIKLSRYKNKMNTSIYAHEIEYSWNDGHLRELNEADIEHIQSMLKEDYVSGELCQYDVETKDEHKGWWKITR